LKACLQLPIGD